jgi:hypothetical protein
MKKQLISVMIVFGISACQVAVSRSPITPPPPGMEITRGINITGEEMEFPSMTISITRSGGLTGESNDEWQIKSDGSIISNGNLTGKLSPQRVQRLYDDLQATGIFDNVTSSRQPVICPDCILTHYIISLPEREIEFYDISGNQAGLPHVAAQLISACLLEATQLSE